MGQGLAGGSRVGRSLTGSSEVGELVGGLLVLVLDVLGNGAWGEHMMSVFRKCVTSVEKATGMKGHHIPLATVSKATWASAGWQSAIVDGLG